jgi:hypothetical protein
MCSLDSQGNRSDAHLHEPILSGIHPDDERRLLERSRQKGRERGFTEEQIKRMYG